MAFNSCGVSVLICLTLEKVRWFSRGSYNSTMVLTKNLKMLQHLPSTCTIQMPSRFRFVVCRSIRWWPSPPPFLRCRRITSPAKTCRRLMAPQQFQQLPGCLQIRSSKLRRHRNNNLWSALRLRLRHQWAHP